VIDGWHRIHRALDLGLEQLPAILLDPGDERAYRLRGGDI
jgi:ParB-like chromosome segregation protein Spo0J